MTGIEIRQPQLTGGTPQEQLGQLQRYLTALAQQLQFAFDAVQGGSPETAAAQLPPRQQEQQRQREPERPWVRVQQQEPRVQRRQRSPRQRRCKQRH